MVITLFFSRFRNDVDETVYQADAAAMRARAEGVDGFVSLKSFRADDGERLTVVVFRDQASHDAWRRDPVHVAAQSRGRDRYYEEYAILVCADPRERRWRREGPAV
jgi:heme-degrading monooxygenase HmoA